MGLNRNYEIRTDGEDRYAVYTEDGNYIEVPYVADEVLVQEKLDEALIQLTIAQADAEGAFFLPGASLYCGEKLVRKDYTIDTSEGAAILEDLEREFPNYEEFDKSTSNLVSRFDAYREPYTNSSISWYAVADRPSTTLLSRFSVGHNMDNIKAYYGLKFDLATKEVILKVGIINIDEYLDTLPDLPIGDKFYSTTHFEDGRNYDWVDVYVGATPRRMKQFCTAKGLEYPLPAGVSKNKYVWKYAMTFNKNTLEYGAVKAYLWGSES
jgi:hypothetical protein